MSMANGVSSIGMMDFRDADLIWRQRSMKLDFDHSRPQATSNSNHIYDPTAAAPPLVLRSRQDSLSNRTSTPYQSYSSQNPATNEQPRSFTSPQQVQQSLHKRPSEASRLRALNNGYRSRSTEGRQTPDLPAENFSRPRQTSLRHRNHSPKPLLHSAATFPLRAHDEEEIAAQLPEPRDRGLSTSSSQSATHFSSVPLRPSASIPDYHTPDSIYSRQRNLNNSGYRSGRGMNRPDSYYSAYRREPTLRETGFDREVRASFRSALTTNSSFQGTSGTERSSVLTKSSSATSVYGKDEGMTVDDFVGMYDGAFTDSGVEDNYGPRPTTANSEQKRIWRLSEAMNDSLVIPPSNKIIRDSIAIFRNTDMDSPSSQELPSGGNGALDVLETYFGQRPSITSVTLPITSQFDATRDRYGFRKKTQHVTLAQYESWNGPYTEYLVRRRKKWVALLKENGLITDHPSRFPPKSAKVKRFVRKGIPPDWRGEAWFYYAGGPSMIAKHHGVYDELVKKAAAGGVSETDDEIIERDLNRTFPDNVKFKPDPPLSSSRDSQHSIPELETPLVQSLRRVLHAFSIYNPRIGYCQSLNFLAGLLLLFMSEEKSFWMLDIITRVYLPGTHEVNLEGANVDLGVLMMSIKESMPAIWTKIAGELDGSAIDAAKSMRLPPITLCTTAWFMSCFIGTLPMETVLRVWDSFFYEGSKTLFRIALTIFKLGEHEIKAVSDPMEIFQVVQTIPRRLVDCNVVLEACFKRRNGFGHLSQETIEQRREERRKGYAEERARANGEVVMSKGPIFGRNIGERRRK